jgi:hypothetical protein
MPDRAWTCLTVCLVIVVFALLAISLVGLPVVNYRNRGTIEGVVVDSYIMRDKDHDNYHHVIQFDDGKQEVFQNRDAFWIGKWNSADIELGIKIGQYYRFDVCGTRWPLFSLFRNIISAYPTN